MEYVVGLDIGTTHCKTVAMASDGQVLLQLQSGYPTIQRNQGQSEQEPEIIFNTVISLLQRTISTLRKDHAVKAIAFSSAMHSIMPVDGSGIPLTNVFTWADTRSEKVAEHFKSTGAQQEIYPFTGVPVHPMLPLCKINWLKQTRPSIFVLARKFISIKEYVFFRLFGKYQVDVSIASATGLFNIHECKWETRALQLAGISASHLSEVVPVTHIETGLKKEYRNLLQLDASIPFVIGSSDGCLANIGSGAMGAGKAALTIGTSGAVRMVGTAPRTDPAERLFNYVVESNFFVTGGPVNNGGIALKWFSENILQRPFASEQDFHWFLQEVEKAKPGSDGLLFLPYLLGERAPHWNATARGVFFGLSFNHQLHHLMRAIVEGVSFALNEVVQAVESANGNIHTVYASGGFTQSPVWLKLLADLLGKRIIVGGSVDASAAGAALVGMRALNWIKELSPLPQLMNPSKEYQPNPEVHAVYEQYFDVFRSLYPKVKDSYDQLNALHHQLPE